MSETAGLPSAEATTEAPPAPALDFTDGASPSNADLGGEEPASTPTTAAPEPAEPRTVPLAALHEERARRKELAAQQKVLESRFGEMQAFLQRQMQPQPAEPPSIDVDPVGHFKARSEQLERQLADVAQPIQQQRAEQQFVQAYRAAAQEFVAEAPDFQDAYQHAWQAMAADAKVLGLSPIDVERAVVQKAMQDGANPAERMYAYAKARGYGAKQAAAQATAADGIAAMQRGAAAARSTAAAPSPSEQNLTAQRLAGMSISDFAKVSDADWRKMMGG